MSKGRSRRFAYRQSLASTIRQTGSVMCHLCLKPITDVDDLTIDHIIPKVHGGNSTFENLQPAHGRCNSWKKDWILPTYAPPKTN